MENLGVTGSLLDGNQQYLFKAPLKNEICLNGSFAVLD